IERDGVLGLDLSTRDVPRGKVGGHCSISFQVMCCSTKKRGKAIQDRRFPRSVLSYENRCRTSGELDLRLMDAAEIDHRQALNAYAHHFPFPRGSTMHPIT